MKNLVVGFCALIMVTSSYAIADSSVAEKIVKDQIVSLPAPIKDGLTAEFSQADTGVAFSMLTLPYWTTPSSQNFTKSYKEGQPTLQAITIANAAKTIQPYVGATTTQYGIAFSIGAKSDFFRYFATYSSLPSGCGAGEASLVTPFTGNPDLKTRWGLQCNGQTKQVAFCGRCTDGGPCAGSGLTPSSGTNWPVLGEQIPYSNFQQAVQGIVSLTGEKACVENFVTGGPSPWNEFDTAGFSASALKGVLKNNAIPGKTYSTPPTAEQMCGLFRYVMKVNGQSPSAMTWPIYSLTVDSKKGKSALTIEEQLQCVAN